LVAAHSSLKVLLNKEHLFFIIYEQMFFIQWNLFPIIAITYIEFIVTLTGAITT